MTEINEKLSDEKPPDQSPAPIIDAEPFEVHCVASGIKQRASVIAREGGTVTRYRRLLTIRKRK